MFDITFSEFCVLDVFKLSRTSSQGVGTSPGRAFASLSCRLHGGSFVESGGVRYHASTDNCLLISEGTPFTHHYSEEETIAVHLSFSKCAPRQIELIPCNRPEIKEKFLTLYSVWSARRAGYALRAKALIYEIFSLFLSDTEKEDVRLAPSMEYLYSSFMSEDFSISKMISLSYLSPAYFRRIFRATHGTTVAKLVNSLRIEHAKALISSRKYKIAQIAALSGFSDEKYFSRIFKQITGSAPSEYR